MSAVLTLMVGKKRSIKQKVSVYDLPPEAAQLVGCDAGDVSDL